jgi:hypothetical protein
MRVYVANFGAGNWGWNECLTANSMMIMDDDRVHPFYLAGDRAGYIKECQKVLKSAKGHDVITPVASRWYGLQDLFRETDGDLWIHREDDELWWTMSRNTPLHTDIRIDPKPTHGSIWISVDTKEVSGWRNESTTGNRLRWPELHVKARDFLTNRATFHPVLGENAEYVKALIEGKDLSRWHNSHTWMATAERSKKGVVTYSNALGRTAAEMASRAMSVSLYGGTVTLSIAKIKEYGFGSKADMEMYLREVLEDSEKICALSGIPVIFEGEEGDIETRASLDRIDSSKGYIRGNVQIVCRFINQWKSDSTDERFLRLLRLVREV